MCDTDSVITDCDLSKHIGLMAEFIPDYKSDDPGAELGSLKCECSDDVKKALKNAKYTPIEIDTALNEMRGGDSTYKVSWRPIAFDAVILSGLKLYTLRKSLPTGEIFTFKHKGVSKAFSSGLSSEQDKGCGSLPHAADLWWPNASVRTSVALICVVCDLWWPNASVRTSVALIYKLSM